MLGIDTNLLLYALNPGSRFHKAAVAFLEQCFQEQGKSVVLSEYVLVELYNLLRNQAVLSKPLSAGKAVEVVESYARMPSVVRVEYAPVMKQVWKYAAVDGVARRRIFDVRLALTLKHHGVEEFATANVKDFEGLGFKRVWNPLQG